MSASLWSDLEAEPVDREGPRYDFSELDVLVQAASESGMVLDLGLNCRSPWATERGLGEIGASSEPCCDFSPPGPDEKCLTAYDLTCKEAWEKFVQALIERYDGDRDPGCRSGLEPADCYRSGDGQRPGFVLKYPAIR